MLEQGDVIELREGHRVVASIPEHFIYQNRRGSWKLCRHTVTIGGEFSYLAGRYVVVRTAFDGGGTAHGPHDRYPDGHHVFCERSDGTAVDFYESGCFTAMNTGLFPVGRASLTWREDVSEP